MFDVDSEVFGVDSEVFEAGLLPLVSLPLAQAFFIYLSIYLIFPACAAVVQYPLFFKALRLWLENPRVYEAIRDIGKSTGGPEDGDGDEDRDGDGDYIPDYEEWDQQYVEPTEERVDENGYSHDGFVVGDNEVEREDGASTKKYKDNSSDSESTSGDEDKSAVYGTSASTNIREPSLPRSPPPHVPPRTLRRSPRLQAHSQEASASENTHGESSRRIRAATTKRRRSREKPGSENANLDSVHERKKPRKTQATKGPSAITKLVKKFIL
ncbi:hypothetical protein PM082_001241 [Marasmius tenuissimus]|nr:hypothetical protein PM082_001241 [Marasmius tenuissimus]